MLYNDLDILPVKTLFKIIDTNDLSLLDPDNKLTEPKRQELWTKLYEDFVELENNAGTKHHFRLVVNYNFYEAKYNWILLALEALLFAYDQELIDMLKAHGYVISKENYHNDIEKCEREATGLKVKAAFLKNQMPKEKDADQRKTNIDEVLASYSLILGFDFDYNVISVTKFVALKKQVKIKIDQEKKQIQKIKSKKGKK